MQNKHKLCSIIYPYAASYILKCFFGQNRKKLLYVYKYVVKIGFSEFSQKVSFLRHMLLSKSYINVAMAVVLS